MKWKIVLFAAALCLAAVACQPSTQTKGTPAIAATGADSGCGSRGLATGALGVALAHVRAARLFATDQDQRLALAKLEPMIVRQIEAEPDSNVRRAAWLEAELPGVHKTAVADLNGIKSLRAPVHIHDARRERYTEYLQRVVGSVNPRFTPRCVREQWHQIFAATLEAQAR